MTDTDTGEAELHRSRNWNLWGALEHLAAHDPGLVTNMLMDLLFQSNYDDSGNLDQIRTVFRAEFLTQAIQILEELDKPEEIEFLNEHRNSIIQNNPRLYPRRRPRTVARLLEVQPGASYYVESLDEYVPLERQIENLSQLESTLAYARCMAAEQQSLVGFLEELTAAVRAEGQL